MQLAFAVHHRHSCLLFLPQILRLLLDAGAEPNAVDRHGNPALKYAFLPAAATTADRCRSLEQDVRATLPQSPRHASSSGTSPRRKRVGAHGLVESARPIALADDVTAGAMIAAMLKHGAVPDLPDADGCTAVHWAAAGTSIVHEDVRLGSCGIAPVG